MALSMDNLLKNLPKDDKAVQTILLKEEDMRQLLYVTEEIEMQVGMAKGDVKGIAVSYMYQLLLHLILNELPNAKYLWKRMPKDVKADPDAQQVWKIGQAIWKNEYSTAFELIDAALNSNINTLFRPLLEKLRVEYRRRCIDLVGLSYSSITIKELLGYVANGKDASITQKDGGLAWVKKCIIKDYQLENAWIVNDANGIVQINHKRESYSLDPKLMAEFTQYVCFMEAQQTV